MIRIPNKDKEHEEKREKDFALIMQLNTRIRELEEENERLKEMNKRAWDNGYLEASTKGKQ